MIIAGIAFKILIIGAMVAFGAGFVDWSSFEDGEETSEMVFASQQNETDALNETADAIDYDDEPEEEIPTTVAPPERRVNVFPVQIGRWTIVGCRQDDETWGCDLRRMMRTASIGIIDILK